jgi:LPS O-antigen subunit length determinant protein (WzzB/FepE family)
MIKEGTIDGLRSAIQVDPANARLAAHFGMALAARALDKATDANQARLDRGEADYQKRRALKLAPHNDEVKSLRAEVVRMLNVPSDPKRQISLD